MAEPPSARLAKKRSDELTLANVLIAGFRPFAGAPEEVKEEEEMEGRRDMGRACNALELAIVTEAKRFIAVSCRLSSLGIHADVQCAACQKVLGAYRSLTELRIEPKLMIQSRSGVVGSTTPPLHSSM